MGSAPLRILHPGSNDSLSVRALRVAVGEAAHQNEADWVALLSAGYRFPTLEPGERLDLEDIEVLLEFVSQRAAHAAAIAVGLHGGLAAVGMTDARTQKDILAGLANFVTGARQWLDCARGVGGAATVEAGVPTIDDPSLPP